MKRQKTGGRVRGTPNKSTKKTAEMVEGKLGCSAIEKLCDRFLEAEKDKKNPQRADGILRDIVSYCHAKPKAVEEPLKDGETPPPAEVVPIDIEARMKALKAAT